MMKRASLPLVAAGLLAACANSSALEAPPEAPRHVPQMKKPTVRLETPLRVAVEEVDRSDTRATVVARVERRLALAVPLTLRLEVPPGVTIAAGRPVVELPPNAGADTVTETWALTFAHPPEGDAVVRVDGDGEGLGFHARVPYRFGRPAPEDVGPAATGPAVFKHGRNLGPSIPLGDAPPPPAK